MNTKIEKSILASLCADAYCLGAHWVYDEEQLKNLPIDWETLNPPQAIWHKGKEKGDFTHYGDQTFFLLEYVAKRKGFDKEDFYSFWSEKMSAYKGYVDGATRGALERVNSESNDLSVCGRLAPLLLVSKDKEDFLNKVEELVGITHNTKLAKDSSAFFAELLYDSLENQDVRGNMQKLKNKYPILLKWINEGVDSKDKDTFATIREFGPACGIDGGFAGVIHLLSLEEDFTSVMTKNAQAGGDSSARGTVVAMILASQESFKENENWTNDVNLIKDVRELLNATV
jgi:ADP-ribosylglycohydrolase